jgi:hypothetical protein
MQILRINYSQTWINIVQNYILHLKLNVQSTAVCIYKNVNLNEDATDVLALDCQVGCQVWVFLD